MSSSRTVSASDRVLFDNAGNPIGYQPAADRSPAYWLTPDQAESVRVMALSGSGLGAPVIIAKTNQQIARDSANTAADATFESLYSFVLPAGLMGPNGSLCYEAETSFTNSASTKQFRLQIGATAITPEIAATTSTNWNARGEWHNTSLTAQKFRSSLTKQGANTGGFSTTTIDTAQDQTVQFMSRWTAAASGEVVRLESLRVWVEYGA